MPCCKAREEGACTGREAQCRKSGQNMQGVTSVHQTSWQARAAEAMPPSLPRLPLLLAHTACGSRRSTPPAAPHLLLLLLPASGAPPAPRRLCLVAAALPLVLLPTAAAAPLTLVVLLPPPLLLQLLPLPLLPAQSRCRLLPAAAACQAGEPQTPCCRGAGGSRGRPGLPRPSRAPLRRRTARPPRPPAVHGAGS